MGSGARGKREQPPIADYGLIGDFHSAALVSSAGSIDWCCLPRFDSGAVFARLLDWEQGGHWSVAPASSEAAAQRDYLEETLILETTFEVGGAQARVVDFMELGGRRGEEERTIVRIVEGLRGEVDFSIEIVPRFDYGAVDAWIRTHGQGVFTAIGGDDGLLITSDPELEVTDRHRLVGELGVRAGERASICVSYLRPAEIDEEAGSAARPQGSQDLLERTAAAWRSFAKRVEVSGPAAAAVRRSALVLKALSHEPTGAIAAAATTSLPAARDGSGARNWDYRYSWVRDSALAVRSLAELGCEEDADAFRRFVERSAAGNAKDLQVVFGVGGERRLVEQQLDSLSGYRGAGPVRVGNSASGQLQLDTIGHLVDQSWRWYQRGHEPDDDYWRFLVDLVEAAVEHWREPDAGIWEWRGEPQHFVHSKAFCWSATDRGLRLAEACMRKAPERRWRKVRDEIREAVESEGVDTESGAFVQAFGSREIDAAVLRLPTVEFVDWEDERMRRTAAVVGERLDDGGLIRRYSTDDGLGSEEGAFISCTFWLATCLANQGELEAAQRSFDRAAETASELGLFSEEYDSEAGELLGNYPQALTHFSHIEAALAIGAARTREAPAGQSFEAARSG